MTDIVSAPFSWDRDQELIARGCRDQLREAFSAARARLPTLIAARLAELPPGWCLMVSEGEIETIEQGEHAGHFQIRHRMIAIDPFCPTPLPIPAKAGRWQIYHQNQEGPYDI